MNEETRPGRLRRILIWWVVSMCIVFIVCKIFDVPIAWEIIAPPVVILGAMLKILDMGDAVMDVLPIDTSKMSKSRVTLLTWLVGIIFAGAIVLLIVLPD